MNTIQQTQQLGQSIWLDYIHRALVRSGELKRLIDSGISGLTANPTILEKAIAGSTDYDDEVLSLAKKDKTNPEIYETLAIEDIRSAADLLAPINERSAGQDGYASLEITPLVAYDTDSTIRESRRLFKAIDRSNVFVKVPATNEGIPAIRLLVSEGINVNITLIFSLEIYDRVKDAYIGGLEDLVQSRRDPGNVASVASFFLSRIDTATDIQLQECAKQGNPQCTAFLGTAALASAKVAYSRFKSAFYDERFKRLAEAGARPQRLLWASTSTKNPAYSDLKYVEPIIGRETVNTLPLATIQAFLDHGKAAPTIEQELTEAERTLQSLPSVGINLQKITDRLTTDGVQAFSDSYNKLMSVIEQKRSGLITTSRSQ